jgi:hypothetical protein
VYNDIHSIEVHIKVYFTDDTNSGDQELETITGMDQYHVYELMVGFSQIDWSKYADKTVEKYEIWLEDNAGNVQSQTRTFIIDTKTYRHERIFMFRNSLGSMDTFRATGRKTQLNEYERLLLEKNDKDFSLQEVYQVLENQTFSINSGWISRETKNWLRELFLSRKEIYEIVDGCKFPIVVTNEKNELFDDDTYLYDVKIDYKYAFRDPYFSGEILTQALLAENGQVLKSEDGQSLYA